jgi:hypothetical protein
MPIPGPDAEGVTPELKLRLKFYCSWAWFLLLQWVFYFYFYSYIFFLFLYYKLYHHHLLIPTLTTFTLPSLTSTSVLKSIAPLPNNLFYPFSPILLPQPSPSPPILPHLVTRLTHPLTHSSPTEQYYSNFTQLHTPAIPNTSTQYYNNRNTPKYIQKPQNPAAPILLPLLTHPNSHLLL